MDLVGLVGGCCSTPLKNMISSVGMMKFPVYGKKNVPKHHQPAFGVCMPEWSIKGQLFVRLTCQIDFVQMAEQQGIKLINIINLPFNASFT